LADNWFIEPCGEARALSDVVYRKCSIDVLSALARSEMALAAEALDHEWMLSSTLKMRRLIVDVVDPHFGVRSTALLAEIDAHAERLRRLIGGQRVAS
jgi:hypothetical protein